MELMERRRRMMLNGTHIGKAEGDSVTTKHALAKPLKKCESDIELFQDLHGQSYPYPAGGGKNIFDCSNLVVLHQNIFTSSVGTSDDGTGIKVTRSASTDSGYPYVYFDLFEITSAHVGKKYYLSCAYTHTPPYTPALATLTASGTDRSRKGYYYTIVDADIGKHLGIVFYGIYTESSVVEYNNVQVEEGTAITAWSPYENICPISGWNGLKLTRTGKNLFDKSNATVYARAMNTVTGKWISYNSKSYVFPCKTDTDYVVTAVRSGLPLFRVAYIKESVIPETDDVDIYNVQQRDSEGSLQIHTGNDATYLVMQPTGTYADTTDIQVEEGTTASPYEPFGTMYEVTFPPQGRNIFDFNNSEFVNREYYNDKGVITENTSYRRLVNYIEVKPSTTYTVQYTKTFATSTGFTVPFYDENKNFIKREVPISVGTVKGLRTGQFTTTATTKYIRFSMTNATEDVASTQIEEGSTVHDFEPYDNTVYRGTIDLLTGMLTVTHGYKTLTANDIEAFGVNSYGLPYMKFNSPPNIAGTNTIEFTCNKYQQTNTAQKDFAIRRASDIYIYDSRITNQQEADALLGTVELVYKHEVPRTFQLTPQQITALKGINNIWADTGKTRIAYWTH